MKPSTPLRSAFLIPGLLALISCIPDPAPAPRAVFDLKPPMLLEAGPTDGRSFVLRFDEEVRTVDGSYRLDPGGVPTASAEGAQLRIDLGKEQEAGREYLVTGEVVDGRGNGSRFLLGFTGFNARPAKLCITEIQTSKNSSVTRPHRDFVEFEVLEAGNLGGLEFTAASSAKTVAWRFPGVEVGIGELVVLHLAPEGLPSEIDETGGDLFASGGIDSSGARDFWSKAGGLPDASGVLVLAESPGGKPVDGIFYSDGSKNGLLGEERLGLLVDNLVDFGLWQTLGQPAWEDAFVWKPSSARTILRLSTDPKEGGAGEWGTSANGGQSPGSLPVQP